MRWWEISPVQPNQIVATFSNIFTLHGDSIELRNMHFDEEAIKLTIFEALIGTKIILRQRCISNFSIVLIIFWNDIS